MQELLLLLSRHEQTTILFVTHDVEEAIFLSTRVLVLSARPGCLIADVTVPFSLAERTVDLKLDPTFLRMKREILALLQRAPMGGPGKAALHSPPVHRRCRRLNRTWNVQRRGNRQPCRTLAPALPASAWHARSTTSADYRCTLALVDPGRRVRLVVPGGGAQVGRRKPGQGRGRSRSVDRLCGRLHCPGQGLLQGGRRRGRAEARFPTRATPCRRWPPGRSTSA